MNKVRNYIVSAALAAILIFSGCQQNQNPIGPVNNTGVNQSQKLTIPIGAIVDSAFIYVRVADAENEAITVHGITVPWDENTATWNNFAAGYNVGAEDTLTPDVPGWYAVNITDLAASWVDSTFDQNGVLLKEESPAIMQSVLSRETGDAPYMLLLPARPPFVVRDFFCLTQKMTIF